MHILIFSDTHLTDQFEEKKYLFLTKIIEQSDQVIINGDFWDGYITTFNHFIHSPWKRLFPLLKAKKAHYLYGNHDKKHFSNDQVELFSIAQGFTYRLPLHNATLHIEHGNRILPFFDETLGLNSPHPFVALSIGKVSDFFIRKYKKRAINLFYRPENKKMKHKLQKYLTNDEILVCGHTHAAEIDWEHRFVNGGLIHHGFGQYLIVDNGEVSLHEEWYE